MGWREDFDTECPVKPTRRRDPLYLAGCYLLDLYCDHLNNDHGWTEFPHQFTGQTYGECAKVARKSGWIIHRDNTATCPKCALRPALEGEKT